MDISKYVIQAVFSSDVNRGGDYADSYWIEGFMPNELIDSLEIEARKRLPGSLYLHQDQNEWDLSARYIDVGGTVTTKTVPARFITARFYFDKSGKINKVEVDYN